MLAQTDCPAGTYSNAGDTFCRPCEAGFQCPGATIGRRACASSATSRSWSAPGQTSCTVCDSNLSQQCDDQAKPPVRCSVGQKSNPAFTACIDCVANKYCATPGDEQNCNPGEYSQAGAAFCLPCKEGHSCNGSSNPVPCSAGEFAPAGSSTCTACTVGWFCSSTQNYPCPRNQYFTGGTCTTITAGKIVSPGTATQIDCPDGQYPESDQIRCQTCPSGHQCTAGSATPVRCATNQYISPTTYQCVACPAGQECLHPNVTPSNCPAGKYVVTPGNYCAVCPRGYFCAGGGADKVACTGTTYALQGQTSCNLEIPNGFGNSPIAPALIQIGFYKDPTTGQAIICPANSYCPSPLHDKIACPNQWISEEGSSICRPTAIGLGGHPFPLSARGSAAFGTVINMQIGYDFIHPCPVGTTGTGGVCTAVPKNREYDYSSATRSTTACAAGYFLPEGQASCRPAPAGYFLNTSGDLQPCGANQYSEPGQTSCTACPNGTYSKLAAQYCTSCPAGYSCDTNGDLTICPFGQYSPNNQKDCSTCAQGFVCYPGTGVFTPIQYPCPKGSYCNLNGTAIQIVKCPAGKFGLMERAKSEAQGCRDCPAGYLCQEGAQHYSLYPCPYNKYCAAGATTAIDCPHGTYYHNLGARQVEQCEELPAGYFYDTGDNQAKQCQPKHYCPFRTRTVQVICPDGTYNPNYGASTYQSCLDCPPGNYCQNGEIAGQADDYHYIPFSRAAQKIQYPLPPGSGKTGGSAFYYAIDEKDNQYAGLGQAMQTCPARTVFEGKSGISRDQCTECNPGSTTCGGTAITCPAGSYCPNDGITEQQKCPAGTYSTSTTLKRASECTICSAGKYCPEGSTTEGDCFVGFYCPPGIQQPIRCPDGSFGTANNLTQLQGCDLCPIDSYCRDGFKYACPAGTYQPLPGEASCSICPGGYSCPGNDLCEKGKYSSPGDVRGCVDCPIGFACNRKGVSAVDLASYRCKDGYNCNALGTQDAVLLTVFGQYSLAGIVKDCPEGTYHYKFGASSISDCLKIPAGYYSTIANFKTNEEFIKCPAGSYCPEGSSAPIPCPKRHFNPVEFGKSLDDCPICQAGYECIATGVSTYVPCSQGSYCPLGSDVPQPCPIGTYGATTGLKGVQECTLCDLGKYCPSKGLTAATDNCYAGFLCKRGSARPDPDGLDRFGGPCPRGGYCPAGATAQSACPPGQYNPLDGGKSANDCAPCPPGHYCSGTTSPEPTGKCDGTSCPEGTSNLSGAAVIAGSYSPQNSGVQYECPQGFYSPGNQASCTPCAAGKYCDGYGATAEVDCPQGYYCPSQTQQDSQGRFYNKIPCPPGTYRSTTGAEKLQDCQDCDGGKACPFYAMISALYNCQQGFFCTTKSISPKPAIKTDNYGPCPKGSYCVAQTTTPVQCAVGKFLNYQGARNANECIDCLSGMYCSKTGLTYPQGACPQGYFCPSGTSDRFGNKCTAQHYCPEGTGSQLVCPDGTYSDQAGAYVCNECPPGYYCKGGNKTICPVGTYCTGN